VTDTDRVDRHGLATERITVPVDEPEVVLLEMAAVVKWVRVTNWQMFLCWLTRGRCGADCVSVTRQILQSAGVPVPEKVRRVKELREWLTHTYKA
jgi:hypothetical protein